MEIKNFIFDLDGTLIDTIGDILFALNATLEKYDLPTKNVNECKEMVGWGFKGLLERAMPKGFFKKESDFEMMLAYFLGVYMQNTVDRTKVYDGINELLSFLTAHKMKTAIATNKDQLGAEKVVNYFFPAHKFSIIRGSNLTQRKPDSIFVTDCLKSMEAKQTETCFVGDSEVDFETAKNGGVLPISVSWGFRSKMQLEKINTLIFDKPKDMIKHFKNGTFIF